MSTLNLGILAHVDAGKTSLTERLLHAVGVIDEIGRVDDGNTQTDSLALERQRGITIKSAVVSFVVPGHDGAEVTVNLIDTPGHPDFIAEVERVLGVLDGAVLVVSAVEGVQAQTRVLMRTLRRLRIPTLIFVNKIDRAGADADRVLRAIADKLTPAIVPMQSVAGLGTRDAASAPYDEHDIGFVATLVERLTDNDEALLAAYIDDEASVGYPRLHGELLAQTRQALLYPVFFGSAITGAGVRPLVAGVAELLPAVDGAVDGPLSGSVFKIDRGPAGEKIAYLRMFSGTIRVRDRLPVGGGEQKVTAISVFDAGAVVENASIAAGQIGKVWGLGDLKIGDVIGARRLTTAGPQHFAPPTLETVVVPDHNQDKGSLHEALTRLAEQDPLINLRHDESRQEISVSLYGEVQKEVIQATLAADFGVRVSFRETTTIYLERPIGTGAAVETIAKQPNPFLATVGLRVEPTAVASGLEFRLGVELGSMPPAFFTAVEETVMATLRQGIYGWQVADCMVTMTHAGYWARQSHAHGSFDKSMSSTAADFRDLTPLVLMAALQQAGTAVYEPMHQFHLVLPADTLGQMMSALTRLRAVPDAPMMQGRLCLLDGLVPAAAVHQLEQQLPGLTRGEGELESTFECYRPVTGAFPSRERTDRNPLDRMAYLLQLKGFGPS